MFLQTLSIMRSFDSLENSKTDSKDTHPKAGLVLGANAAADATQAARIAVFIVLGDIITNQKE